MAPAAAGTIGAALSYFSFHRRRSPRHCAGPASGEKTRVGRAGDPRLGLPSREGPRRSARPRGPEPPQSQVTSMAPVLRAFGAWGRSLPEGGNRDAGAGALGAGGPGRVGELRRVASRPCLAPSRVLWGNPGCGPGLEAQSISPVGVGAGCPLPGSP